MLYSIVYMIAFRLSVPLCECTDPVSWVADKAARSSVHLQDQSAKLTLGKILSL